MRYILLPLLLVTLVGCGSNTDEINTPVMTQPVVMSEPAAIDVPAINAKSSLIHTGLDRNGELEVPDVHQPKQASWYENSPVAGQVGPSVYLGHVDGDGKNGVFHDLTDLSDGDKINITSTDSSVHTYTVYRVLNVPKDAFPTQMVYGDTSTPEARLITCGGSFDKSARSYRENVIVFGKE